MMFKVLGIELDVALVFPLGCNDEEDKKRLRQQYY